MSPLSPVLHGDDLPEAELRAMRLDGEVFALADAWCPLDVGETPEIRARAVIAGRSSRLVAERRTAAWVWGAIPAPPFPLELCSDASARVRVRPGSDCVVREVVLRAGDTVRWQDAQATTPARTFADLARQGWVDDELLRALASAGSVTRAEVLALLARSPLPGRATAARTAERLLA